jgi:thioredoxin reductase
MANGLSYEEAIGQQPGAASSGIPPPPSTSGGISYEEAMGGTPPPRPPQSLTPYTDAAIAGSPINQSREAMRPKVDWSGIRTNEQYLRALQNPPSMADIQQAFTSGPMTQPIGGGLPILPHPPDESLLGSWARGAYNVPAGFYNAAVTPAGVATLGAFALGQPQIGAALLAAQLAPGAAPMVKQIGQAVTGQLPPGESFESGLNLGLMALPGAHPLVKRMFPPGFEPVPPPTGPRAPEVRPDVLPGPPIPAPGTEEFVSQPGPRGFVAPGAAPAAPTEPIINHAGDNYKYDPVDRRWNAVDENGAPFEMIRPEDGIAQRSLVKALNLQRDQTMAGEPPVQPIQPTEGGEQVASTITGTTGVPGGEVRSPLDATARVLEQRATAPVRPEPQPEAPAVAPTIPEEPNAPQQPVSPLTDAQYKHLDRKQAAGYALTDTERQQVLEYEAKPSQQPVSPYFIERHPGGIFAIVDRRDPGDVGLITHSLERAQARKAELDAGLAPAAAAAGTQEAAIGDARAALMRGDITSPDFPDVAGAAAAPVAAAGAKAPEKLKVSDVFGPTITTPGEETPEARIARLTTEIGAMRQQKIPVPLEKSQELQKLQAAQPIEGYKSPPSPDLPRPPTPVSQATGQTYAQIEGLKFKADRLQNEIGDMIGKTPTIDEMSKMKKLWTIFNQIHQIREQTGERRAVGIIGHGAGGLTLADHLPYEGSNVVVFGTGPVGGAAAKSQEIINVGRDRKGVTGKVYFREKYLTAKNLGTEFRKGDVVDIRYANGQDGKGGLDIYTGTRNEKGEVTAITGVTPVWRAAIFPGARIQTHLEGKPFFKLAGWGDAGNLVKESQGGKTVATYGAGNSATQAIFGALRPGGAKKVIAISRHDFGSEASENQKRRLYDLRSQGKIQFVTGDISNIEKNPAGGVTIRTKQGGVYDVAHIENFLDSTLNTDSLPNTIERVPFRDANDNPIPLNKKPGMVKVIDAGLRTTMEGLYAGGDARGNIDPYEQRPKRIQMAEGDAAGNSARIHADIEHLNNYGTLPEWHPTAPPTLPIDEHLKILRGQEPPETTGTLPGGLISGNQPRTNLPPLKPIEKPSVKSTPTTAPTAPGLPRPVEPTEPRPMGYGRPPEQVPRPQEAPTPGYGRPAAEAPRVVEPGYGRPQAPPRQVPPVQEPPREAIGWEQALKHGDDFLARGGNINQVINDFRRTGQVNTWDMGKMQANLERVQDATNKAGDALRKNPKDTALQERFETAQRNEQQFTDAYNPMYAVGKATQPTLQGHPPMNAASAESFTGMKRRFMEYRNKDMTAAEEIRTDSMTKKAQQANTDYSKANGDIYKKLDSEYGKMKTDRTGAPTLEDLGRTFSQPKEVC